MFGWLDALTRRPALLGAVLALLVGALTYGYARDAHATAVPAPAPTRVAALVARRDLPAGATITPADVEVRNFAPDTVDTTALHTADAAIGHYAAAPLAAGEQITTAAVSATAPGSPLAREIPGGDRAVSIAISDAIAAGGLVAPGDRVDVIGVFKQRTANYDGSAMIVDDVEVLAVSAAVVGNDTAGTSGPASGAKSGANPQQLTATVTLAVTPLEAQRLAIAAEFGALRIALRRPGDNAHTTMPGVGLGAVTGAAALPAGAPTAPPAGTSAPTVTPTGTPATAGG